MTDEDTARAINRADAAAPDLLAALIDLMGMIDSPQITLHGVVGQQWAVTLKEARAAIAKAKGAA